jgi:hypothetical protein
MHQPATAFRCERSSATRWKAACAATGTATSFRGQIINRFTCDFNGENVIDVTLEPAISTNPYFQFEAVVNETGTFQFTWYDDDGSVYEETADITVS